MIMTPKRGLQHVIPKIQSLILYRPKGLLIQKMK